MKTNRHIGIGAVLLAALLMAAGPAGAQRRGYGGGGRYGDVAEGGDPAFGDGAGGSGELSGGTPSFGDDGGSDGDSGSSLSSDSERIAQQLARGKSHPPAAEVSPKPSATPSEVKPSSRSIKNNSDLATF